MKTYIVVKEGIYFQAIYGPYSSAEEATKAATTLSNSEPDNYHDFSVYKLTPEGVGTTYRDGISNISKPITVIEGGRK